MTIDYMLFNIWSLIYGLWHANKCISHQCPWLFHAFPLSDAWIGCSFHPKVLICFNQLGSPTPSQHVVLHPIFMFDALRQAHFAACHPPPINQVAGAPPPAASSAPRGQGQGIMSWLFFFYRGMTNPVMVNSTALSLYMLYHKNGRNTFFSSVFAHVWFNIGVTGNVRQWNASRWESHGWPLPAEALATGPLRIGGSEQKSHSNTQEFR